MNDSRIKAYALTAGGTAVLAAAIPTTADIISNGVANPIPASTGTYGQQTGETLFSFEGVVVVASNNDSASMWGNTTTYAFAGAKIHGTGPGGSGKANFQAVSAGSIIDQNLGSGSSGSSPAIGPKAVLAQRFRSSGTVDSAGMGGLVTGNDQLVAFQLLTGGESTYYGWVNYTLSFFEGSFSFTINSWAYNDVSGEGIIAGQNTAAGSSVVPGLGGLAALAIGAAGVRSRRQRVA